MLRAEREKLLKLAKAKRKAEEEKLRATREISRLKDDISKLKKEVSNDLRSKLARAKIKVQSPETKREFQKFTCRLRKTFKEFKTLCNKYGGLD